MTYEAFDVVVVPFPFTENATAKRRPALVLSELAAFNKLAGHSVLAMITSAKNSDWPLDVRIENIELAGLPSASIVRMKLFTLDDRLVIKKAGSLAKEDRTSVKNALQKLMSVC